MVVSRRKPVVPAPGPASRSNSSQTVPRAAKSKPPQSSLANATTLKEANGHEKSSKKVPSANKSKSKKKKKQPSLLTYLRNILLTLTTIYAFLACPDSPVYTSPSSPLFSSPAQKDHQYRNLPITPYQTPILPPPHPLICKTILTTHDKIILPFHAHVVSPLFAQISQATHKVAYSDTFSPYTLSASDFYHTKVLATYDTYVVPFVNRYILPQFHQRVVPFYTERVVPFINTRVIPIFKDHIIPAYHRYYSSFVLPYWRKYVSRPLAPYVQASIRLYNQSLAPVVSRLGKIASNIGKILLKGWNRLHPYLERFLINLFERIKVIYLRVEPRLIVLAGDASHKLGQGLSWVGTQREVYVDPHVKQIWVKVKELSGNDAILSGEKATPGEEVTLHGINVDSTSSLQSVEDSPTPLETPMRASSPIEGEPVPTSASSLTSTHPSATEEPVIPTSVPENEGSILSEYSSVAPGTLSDEAASHAASIIQESLFAPSPDPTTDVVAEVTSLSSDTAPSSSPIPEDQLFLDPEGFVDLEDFLAGLGIDLNDATAPVPEPETSTSVVEATPSSPARKKTNPADMDPEERAAFMAERRVDITSRHARWESEIETMIEEKTKEIAAKVAALRKAGVDAVLTKDSVVQVKADDMVKEGEKLLKGVAGWVAAHQDAPYAKAIAGQSEALEREKARDRELFDKLVAKVQERFRDKVGEVEDIVREWYMGVRNQEIQEVLRVEEEVKSLAEGAQADIGLDYAWLDDVTYQDWQRYHDLVRRSERFSDIARSLQNSTHETSPEDPMIPALEDLRAEVQDIVNGFQSRLRSHTQNAEQVFAGAQVEDANDVGDAGRDIEDDGHGNKPAVPVPPPSDENADLKPSSDAIPPVLLGRSEEEILQAMGRAAQADGRSAESVGGTEALYGSGTNEIPPAQSSTAQLPVHVEL